MKHQKFLNLLVILAALPVLALPMSAQAQFTFRTNNGAITITGYTGLGGNVIIPGAINGLPVTDIETYAFQGAGLSSVTIPDSVTNIGSFAFQASGLTSVTIPANVTSMGDAPFGYNQLTSLTVNPANPSYASASGVLFDKTLATLIEYPASRTGSYTIPSSVTSIGNQAFDNCGLTNVAIPDSVTNIGNYAFFGCPGLKSATIGNSVTTIGDYAFADCSLTSVTIPGSVTTIGRYAFQGNGLTNVTIPANVTSMGDAPFGYNPLTSLTVNPANPSYASVSGVLFDKTLATLIEYPASRTVSYTIPNSVTTIGNYAFAGCSLTRVTIPDSVTSIGVQAFEGWGLTSVTIPDSVTNIGDFAFDQCDHLGTIGVSANNPSYTSLGGALFNKAVTTMIQYPGGRAGSYVIPNSVTSIGVQAFDFCTSLTGVTIGKSVTTIGDRAFYNCYGLSIVRIPDSVTAIGAHAFEHCTSLTSVTIGKSVTTIGDSAFNNCSGLSTVTIPDSVTAIGVQAFYDCSLLKSVTIGKSVTTIGQAAFSFCTSLTSVTIPDSVTAIGVQAFYDCSLLKSVTIGSTVTSIGYYAFQFCMSLRQIFFRGNAPSVNGVAGSADKTVFDLDGTGKAYYVPGTVGWGATFGGWPMAQWYQPKPQILGSGNNLDAGSPGFQFTISWATNTSVVVEASTDLQNWTPVSTNTLVKGSSTFLDSTWTNYPQQSYRLRSH